MKRYFHIEQDVCYLSSDWMLENVVEIEHQLVTLNPFRQATKMDCSDLAELDSAGLALIVNSIHSSSTKLQLVNPTESFITLLGLYNLRELFSIEETLV